MGSASEFGKDLGLMHEVVVTGRKAGFTAEDWGVLAHDEDKIRQVLGLIRGDIGVRPDIICVDRSARPTYPDLVKEILHPELERTGPTEYSLAQVELWLHRGQKDGKCVKGQVIYEHLRNNNMLESCLGLADLLAIQAKGIVFFRRHFAGKAVFGWKSVVRYRNGSLSAPYLYEYGDEVVLHWSWLGRDWYDYYPALRFAN